MKRAKTVVSFITVALVVIIGFVAIFQWDNIKALYISRTHSEEEIEAMLRENSKLRDDALSGIAVRKLTDEEKEAIKNGEFDSKDALSRILETSANEDNTKQDADFSETSTERDYEAELANLIGQIYVLEASYSGAIEGLLSNAISEYKALPPEQHTDSSKWDIGIKYLGTANSMEANCDQKMASILNEIESVLIASGKDMSLLSQIKSGYQSEKTLKKEYYLSLYS